jgi:hypothetical protein
MKIVTWNSSMKFREKIQYIMPFEALASEHFSNRIINMQVGEYDDWIKLSDHMPLITEFND